LIGKAFYVVGMHPNSSRIARQSPFPTIVFNLHWQFEKLRQMGSYETVRDRIRERDEELQGSMNPMLSDFGKGSEAKQYSGKKVDDNWKCPFHK
jgi:FPC/CPF motif-containing protein YcgG